MCVCERVCVRVLGFSVCVSMCVSLWMCLWTFICVDAHKFQCLCVCVCVDASENAFPGSPLLGWKCGNK